MEVNCPTCGASMQISHTTDQFMCTYCGTTTSLNKADTLYTYIMPFAVTDPRAKDIFKRWATGPGKAPDLLRGSKNVKWEKYYLPVAKVVRLVRDEEEVFIFSLSEKNKKHPDLKIDAIPSGDMQFYQGKEISEEVIPPDDAVLDNFLRRTSGKPKEQAIVYVPVYHVLYRYGDKPYSLVINGITGSVYVTDFAGETDEIYNKCAEKWFYGAIVGGFIAGLSLLLPVGGLRLALIILIATVAGILYKSREEGLELLTELERLRSVDPPEEVSR